MPGTGPTPDGPALAPAPGSAWRVPASAWLRPCAVLLGGLAVAVVLVLVDQPLGGALVAAFALFMGWWTSPLRSGPHTPMAEALERREDAVSIVVWAPGDPLSARLHTAIRGDRPDVVWVNAYQDPTAARFVELHGGRAALPLVVVGDVVAARATVGRFLDLQAEGRERAAAAAAASELDAAADPEPDDGAADPR